MAEENGTGVIGFLLKGLSDLPEVRFAAFGAVYTATLLANGALLLALRGDHRLHTLMYFLLNTLSLLDVFCPMAAGKDVFFLAVTASEHRLAVIRPLHYAVLMDWSVCVALAAGAWPTRFLNSPLHVSFSFTMTFCLSNLVDRYYCDVPSGKRRTWSICTSCLLAVGLFYDPAIITYIRPSCGHSPGSKRLLGMLFGVLNPFIDSLKNEEVKLLRQKLGPLGSLWHP
ncbi:olfactory receptor 5B12-like [Tachyglossus aculeatus]|uniref:olfactory receptor 5B12-like n=1 Tax=Tachyglossus aculeatus TaxID=9261 RepID=UPI0018F747C5|nr:olfactory receptor 5B12-like [Tachyglossus aculeatus]